MRKLAAAIEMDIKTTFEMMQENDMKGETIKRNYEEKKKLNSLEAELSRKGTDLDLLRAEHFQLEGRIQNTESWDILQSQAVSLAENKLELENSVRRLVEEKKMVGNRDACLETERALRILLTELERENDSIKMEYNVKVKELERKLEEMKNREENVKEYDTERNEVGLYEETILMPGDDPELDMTRQFISNRQKIELLQRQNERLSKTLNRLREYRLTTITTTTTTMTMTTTTMKMKTTNTKSLLK
ncbi:macoilin-like isoform X1 [Polistes fuscatus]|uniref:macoilin-like isoform X1 n=1 Tax=Polistes fuscatus TaxID=30207 RepID=UPI001CA9B6F1|nr:macoilin-like isoform X1 [Polistes fuscatus]